MKLNIKNKILLGSCLTLALVIILAFISNQSMNSLVETRKWVEHTYQVLDHASQIEKLMVDMETGKRGFLIAGKEEFLEPYEDGKQRLSQVLNKTRKLVSDNPAQIKRLDKIEQTIKLWETKVAIPEISKRRQVVKNSDAIKSFENLQTRIAGKKVFDNIRYEFKLIRSEFELENNFPAVISTIDTLKSLLDMEAGHRGFLLTGKQISLEPFREGQKAFEKNIKTLKAYSENSKSRRIIRRSITRIEELVKEWFAKSVNPEIEARRVVNQVPATMEEITSLIEEGTGKRIMDDIRRQIAVFKQAENELMAVRKLEANQGVLLTRSVILFGTLLVLILSFLSSYWLAGNISKPINILKKASLQMGKGVYPDSIEIDSKDEIADLGNAFKGMVDKINDKEKAILLEKENAERARDAADSARTQAEKSKKEAESAKIDAEKANQAKSLFLANMSHEIRTPLNAVLGYSQILRRDESLSKSQLEAIETIYKSGNHLLDLINDILDISKIEAGKMELNNEEFDLGILINELKPLFSARCSEKGLVLNMEDYPEGKMILCADFRKLRQVLVNLIGNAVKFTNSGSVGFRLSNQGSGNHFLFEVTDTGPGIPEDAQETIFEPFKQDEEGVNKGGTGLGLAISQKQIKQMGGKLEVDSEPGKGSRFYFTIPLERRKSRSLESSNNLENNFDNVIGIKSDSQIKVLVVDDVQENRDVLISFLKSMKVSVEEAENGKVALEKIDDFKPNLIFMDIRMPVMNGVEAFKKIKDLYPEEAIKIICITASTLRHEQDKYIDLGFDSYISKPFKHADILKALENSLDIELEYKTQNSNELIQESSDDLDWSSIKISPEIKTQILTAARVYNITRLESAVEQLNSMNNAEKQLGVILEKLLKSYDMKKIISVMENLP